MKKFALYIICILVFICGCGHHGVMDVANDYEKYKDYGKIIKITSSLTKDRGMFFDGVTTTKYLHCENGIIKVSDYAQSPTLSFPSISIGTEVSVIYRTYAWKSEYWLIVKEHDKMYWLGFNGGDERHKFVMQ